MSDRRETMLRLYAFLSERNIVRYREVVSEAAALDEPLPERYGAARGEPEVANAAQRVAFRTGFCIEILDLANREFDALERDFRRKARLNSRLKLFSSLIGAVSSSSLIAMILAGSLGTERLKIATGTLAFISAVVVIFAENSRLLYDGFWERISVASSLRARSDILLRKLRWQGGRVMALDDLDLELAEAEKIANELDGLRREMGWKQLRGSER